MAALLRLNAPSLLVSGAPRGMRPHVGTADLDFHLSLHLLDGETADYYQAIIDGLRSLGLRTDVQGEREIKWRWVGRYRDARLQVEFLCPIRGRAGRPEKPATGTPAEANVGPAGEITALAVGYGHLVPGDTVLVERRVPTSRGMLGYEFPVAGPASWLCLKADAIMRRDKPKDASPPTSSVTPMRPAQRCMPAFSALAAETPSGDTHMERSPRSAGNSANVGSIYEGRSQRTRRV